MTKSSTVFRAGTRDSALARRQTRTALDRIEALVPGLRFDMTTLDTPGDRDRRTDLRTAPGDFFTRDLDEAVLSGRLDCALHSAKDLEYPLRDGLDWCWLPWSEDPRDALVFAPGIRAESLPETPVAGVSSDRREAYCRRRFGECRTLPIRGNIEARLAQLDAGSYDVVVMAAAALVRLGLTDRISEWIPLEELPTPAGQGVLALTFRLGDERLTRLRSLFVKAVTFVGAGVGSAGLCTVAGVEALRQADICLFDTLMDDALLEHLPAHAERIGVGKRCGEHSVRQEDTTRMIAEYARRGRRVVRLKGGDPGIFGRLAEETDALDALHLPYRVVPGVSSLTAATTATGMLLTRRGVSRGFCVLTPRAAGGDLAPIDRRARGELPLAVFMGARIASQMAADLIADELPRETPAALVLDAGADDEETISASLEEFARGEDSADAAVAALCARRETRPGLFLVGDIVSRPFPRTHGALQGRRVLLTCSAALQAAAGQCVLDAGGVPVHRPLIRMVTDPDADAAIGSWEDWDWLVLTSPSSVRCLAEVLRNGPRDLRRIPGVVVCGTGTAAALRECLGIQPDVCPESDFSADAVIAAAGDRLRGARVLRLRSDRAGPSLADRLRECGAEVRDVILYRNVPVSCPVRPRFDAAVFASSSAVDACVDAWGVASLRNVVVAAIGAPTAAALARHGIAVHAVGSEATIERAVESLAACLVAGAIA